MKIKTKIVDRHVARGKFLESYSEFVNRAVKYANELLKKSDVSLDIDYVDEKIIVITYSVDN